jgi:hypothetical protein
MGLGAVRFDLVSGNCVDNVGGWTQITRRAGWEIGSFGTPQPNGEMLDAQAGQVVMNGFPVSPLRPITGIWRGVWIPANYAARDIVFEIRPAQAAGKEHSSLAVKYDEDENGRPLYVLKFVAAPAIALHFNPSLPSGCCYANCDGSAMPPVLNVNDFVCFQARFAAGDPYADCDYTGVLNVEDFICFLSSFAAGCP